MLRDFDTDLTLPALVASTVRRYREEVLRLTVVFHPDTNRIGQCTEVGRHCASEPWVLGRYSPDFARPGDDGGAPLQERHVSRRALQLEYMGRSLVIRRFDGSSRARVAGRELVDAIELRRDDLAAGVPIVLGHGVVLLLRLGPCAQPAAGGDTCRGLLRGASAWMDGLRDQVARAAAQDLDVLVRGETGTGKELVAAAIHRASARAAGPLVSVNMAAIPVELAPAALFGSARGAFTGAARSVPGYFQQAARGTLLLDEIGDAPAAVQPQLLRALQQREVQSVGGPVQRVDLRVISATDAALDAPDSTFNAALRHRLGACEIRVPALRDHPEDIGELLLHFLSASAAQQRREALLPGPAGRARELAAWAEVFYRCLVYPWPGNVRELDNAARQLVLAGGAEPGLGAAVHPALAPTARQRAPSPRRRLRDIDERTFEQAMASNGYEPRRVARHLGVSRTAVYRRIAASPRYRLVAEIPREELEQVLRAHDGDYSRAAASLRVAESALRSRLRKLSPPAG